MNRKSVNYFNNIVLIFVLLAAVITTFTTLYDLADPTKYDFGDGAQSRLDFRFGSLHIFLSFIILLLTTLLAIGWKRLFPYNVPIAIILIGFCYVLTFLTFTVGWVGIQGMMGFVIAFLIGILLIIVYLAFNVINKIKGRETPNKKL
ncbi:RND transporter [Bacillus sp. BGMRC 2118]|nr:RND transporter [Bacillus sp. BGMRC 2118]